MTPSKGTPSKLRTLRPWLFTAIIFAGVVGLIMWLHSTSSGAPAAQGGRGGRPSPGQMAAGQGTAVTVSVAPALKGDLPVHYHALGTVTAYNTVNVRARVSGQLVKVPFQEGQEVKAGDVLAVIDPRPFQAALDQAQGTLLQNQAQLKNAQIDLARYKGLYAEDSIAKQTLDTQEALVRQYEGTLKTNQGQVSDAKLNLEFTQVRAPISGRVGLRQVDVGNLVTSGDTTPLVVITQVKPISVVFSLPQQQLGTIARELYGDKPVPVQALDRNQNQTLASGVLKTLDNQIDTTTGTVKLKAGFDNDDHKLFPNQFVNVRLLAETLQGVLTIPANAVQRGNDGTYVYKVGEEDKAKRQLVTLGTSEGERVVVSEGLKEGDRVVVEGTDRLRDGMRMNIVASDEKARAAASEEGDKSTAKPFGSGNAVQSDPAQDSGKSE
ncbi:MdtA/MuxA family multidrug efflux RND transporter periplasmic adaptor subunit [Pseudomonas sp. MT3]|uniref:MdtA/MuxA family multidrug efflux RND transporter periplasmic adaptor subunit n=1 Tax=Pseudomonas sp. ATCC 13867 TaxID=1294143 RepID=UPI0005A01C81|nr:MdtA/MuxA family multidrug efflux RND transporter periplasmic adaptor subunit [Pseudomonas sp. ATCC 13867]RFQ38299.1 MdtA/MuxA family multidrug efflux RND transporter periplasmic adaptor subunit [Pseudomonas sp. ATCC 13867]